MKSFGFYLHGSQYFRAPRAWRTKSSQLEVLINIFRGSTSSFCFWKVQDNRSPNRRLVPSPPNPMTSWSFHDITCSWRGSYTLPSPYCTLQASLHKKVFTITCSWILNSTNNKRTAVQQSTTTQCIAIQINAMQYFAQNKKDPMHCGSLKVYFVLTRLQRKQ